MWRQEPGTRKHPLGKTRAGTRVRNVKICLHSGAFCTMKTQTIQLGGAVVDANFVGSTFEGRARGERTAPQPCSTPQSEKPAGASVRQPPINTRASRWTHAPLRTRRHRSAHQQQRAG
ncbi:hypothetical protein F2P81_009181 [Scophthalmus maximus]|uniref:Uncharacterized protein n=1 Tax=Scophthalmus maximus TaxID=52904 RepID=A0A6A4SYJ2_SCOMX|nr:hypothetical protein F2P81_009181 [Scophthalmus maximus]